MSEKNQQLNQSLYKYATLYAFANIIDLESFKYSLKRVCNDNKILGTILIANEGINGTISGYPDRVNKVIKYIQNYKDINNLEIKYSNSKKHGFYRMKVKIKKEIVTMGIPYINPSLSKGKYIEAKNWNEFITQDNVMVVDTRNYYETTIGSFKNALDPKTNTFKEFPNWADNLANKIHKDTKIAMYCTGGIRCEKATSYLIEKGFKDVYHLKGGILKYLEEIPKNKSLWEGDCFVFDQRVSVKHNLKQGEFDQCFACKMPLLKTEYSNKKYVKGVSCHHCFDNSSKEQKERFAQRQKQIELSSKRGEDHLGQKTPSYRRHSSKS